MSDFAAVSTKILEFFTSLWLMLIHNWGFVGVVICGFVVLRIISVVISSFQGNVRAGERAARSMDRPRRMK